MQQHISLRSHGTIEHRRDQFPWTEEGFKILSIDGGGIKGILPAAVLAECERRFISGRTSADYFDMIGGTSTGGIIALGLGLGMAANDVLDIYLEQGATIFPERKTWPIPGTGLIQTLYHFTRDLQHYRYEREPLEKALRGAFCCSTLGDSRRRLVIPSFDGFNEVTVFKTPHHPDFKLDWKEEVVTIALATSAAPTFFPLMRTVLAHSLMAAYGPIIQSW